MRTEERKKKEKNESRGSNQDWGRYKPLERRGRTYKKMIIHTRNKPYEKDFNPWETVFDPDDVDY
jgi:hypothetical protein